MRIHNIIGDKMFIKVLSKTIFLYFFIIVSYRIMGKKEVGELSIIDLIVTILIADFAAICIENYNKSFLVSLIPIIILVIMQVGLSYLSLKSNKFRNIIEGKPSVIIKAGKVCFNEMSKIRYSLDDLISQLRDKGIKSIEEVDYAVLENTGTLSVFPKEKNYPMPIILDGVIDYDVLKEINKDNMWIHRLLSSENVRLEDVFYAFYSNDKTYIIKKSDLI